MTETSGVPPRYEEGQRVWLAAFCGEPRELGVVVGCDGGDTYLVRVKPRETWDDGLRAVPVEQIEGPAS